MEKLMNMFNGPTTEIQAKEVQETRKFSGHCRLYVGNIPNDLTEDEFVNLFTPFGETSEHFVNRDKNFGFIKMVRTSGYYPTVDGMWSFIDFVVMTCTGLPFQRREGKEWAGPDACSWEESEGSLCPARGHRQDQEPVCVGLERTLGEGHVHLWRRKH
jgi:hypothetical protein